MKNLKKSITVILLLFVMCLGLGIATACTPENSGDNTPSITLNKVSITLDLDESVNLLAETQGVNGDIVWSTDAPSVATVTDGKIQSVGEGTAKITASCGNYSATCVVVVTCAGKMPVLKLNGDNSDVELMLGTDFTVNPQLTYNGKVIDNVVYEYSLSDETVASVDDNGNLIGKTKGSSTVQVKASWKHFVIYENFLVKYVPESYILTDKQEIVLYTSNIFGDKTTESIGITVVNDGVKVENPDIEYTYDDTAIKIENGIVSVLKKVDTEYDVVATYTADEPMSVTFTVKTVFPVRDMQDEYGTYEFEAMGDNVPSSFDCFTDGSSIVGVYDLADLENNLVQGGKLVLDTKYYGERTWMVKSSNGYAYKVGGTVITKIITTPQEFQSIFMTSNWTHSGGWTTDASQTYYDGYYVLGNDIIFASETYNDCKYRGYDVSGNDGVPENAGFNGIFDGRGHTVANIWLYSNNKVNISVSGIFGTIGKKGVVKNVAFINGGGVNWVHSYLANAIAGTVDNVFLQLDLATYNTFYTTNMGVLSYRILPTAKITNTVTYLSGEPYGYSPDYSQGVCSFANRIDKGATLSNIYSVATFTGYVAGTTWDKINENFTTSQIKAYNKAGLSNVDVNKNGFVEEYWDLTDNLLPVMKSSLSLPSPRIEITSNFVLSGAKVEIRFNDFEYRYLDLVSSHGTINDGGNGEGQTDRKAILDLTGVANETVTVTLRFAGRTLQTCELVVGGNGQETEVNLNKSVVYTLKNWNATGKSWTANNSDLVINGLTTLSGKTIKMAYVCDKDNGSMQAVTVSLDGDKLTIGGGSLKNLSVGEKQLYIIAGNEKYLIDLSLVTAELTTEEQFVSIFLSDWHGMEWSADESLKNEMYYDGYYVLGGNIEFSDKYYVNKYRSWGANAKPIPIGVGFNGIFDGKGYTISNLGVTNRTDHNCVTGIFGTIGKEGIVRNVAFVNGRMEGRTLFNVSSYFAVGIAGTVDNVFVHIDLSKCSLNRESGINVFGYGLDASTRMTNCVAYVSGIATTNYTYQGQTFGEDFTESKNVKVSISVYRHNSTSNDGTVSCYLIVDDRLKNDVSGLFGFNAYSETEVKNGATFATAGWNGYWDLTGYDLPVISSAKTYVVLDGFKKN